MKNIENKNRLYGGLRCAALIQKSVQLCSLRSMAPLNLKNRIISALVFILIGCGGQNKIGLKKGEKRETTNRGSMLVKLFEPTPHTNISNNAFVVSKLVYSIKEFDPEHYECDLSFLCTGKRKGQTRGPNIMILEKPADIIEVRVEISNSDIQDWSDTMQCQFVITEGLKNSNKSRPIIFSETFEFSK